MLKKITAIFVSVLMTVALIPFSAVQANAESKEYLPYYINNEEAIISECDKSISGDLIIPSKLGGYPVTAIGLRAFSGCNNLTSVTMPDSITSIGLSAFKDCSNLIGIPAALLKDRKARRRDGKQSSRRLPFAGQRESTLSNG